MVTFNEQDWSLSDERQQKDLPRVQACRGAAMDSPWYPLDLALFGDLPDMPNQQRNRRNGLRDDTVFGDLGDITSVDGDSSVQDSIWHPASPDLVCNFDRTPSEAARANR